MGGDTHVLEVQAFLAERDRVEDHAAADDIDGSFPENAGGDAADYEFPAFEMEGMSGVRTALEPGDGGVAGRKDIYDLAFAFIAPLESEYDIYFHDGDAVMVSF